MTSPTRRYTTKEASQQLGISKDTLLRWLYKGYVREPRLRDRHGWRIWTQPDIERVALYRDRTEPAPQRPAAPRRELVPEEVSR